MSGGLRFTPEQIREMPLHIQLQIGLGIVAQLAQASAVADNDGKTEEEGGGA